MRRLVAVVVAALLPCAVLAQMTSQGGGAIVSQASSGAKVSGSGTSGKCAQWDSANSIAASASACGGGTVGTDKQILFNDAGTTAGDAGLTYRKSSKSAAIGGAVINNVFLAIAPAAASSGTNMVEIDAPSSIGNGNGISLDHAGSAGAWGITVLMEGAGTSAYHADAAGVGSYAWEGGAGAFWNADNVAIGGSQRVGGQALDVVGSAKVSGNIVGAGTAPAVSNTTANSCGTTTATLTGSDITGVITVGATAGTSCTLTFVTAATTRRQCVVNNETTANLARATYTDTTHSVFAGTFVAGDKLAYVCATY